jgi:hypothetical protein
VAVPLLTWFYFHPIQITGNLAVTFEEMGFEPILPFSLAPELFTDQFFIVMALLAVCSLYPMVRILNLKVADTLKGNL